MGEETWKPGDVVIARAILRYLQEHRDAKDTLEGIAQWWLLKEGREHSLAEVERAVALLLSRSLVVETRRGALPPFYQLNHTAQHQIAEFERVSPEEET